MVSIMITLGVIAVALFVTFLAGAAGLIGAIFVALLLTCYFDPNGLSR